MIEGAATYQHEVTRMRGEPTGSVEPWDDVCEYARGAAKDWSEEDRRRRWWW